MANSRFSVLSPLQQRYGVPPASQASPLISNRADYPIKEPTVKSLTTNGGQTRFNPNIYAEGKVCLSILGTWRGEAGEGWSSAQSLESVLLSIQSLMSSNPYENEPGFESQKTALEKSAARDYAAKIRHETLRISVIQRLEELLQLEGPLRREDNSRSTARICFNAEKEAEDLSTVLKYDPFADHVKNRFLWYYHVYLSRVQEAMQPPPKEATVSKSPKRSSESADEDTPAENNEPLKPVNVKEGTPFQLTAFESKSNGMNGIYNYPQLLSRLEKIRKALDAETDAWERAGLMSLRKESPTALWFQNQYKNILREYKRRSTPVDIELIEGNPFAWRLILFGRPMTNLDGGVFRIKIVFSLNFPAEQPRVRVETPLFHQRVSSDGVLCYLVAKSSDVESHISGIIQSIEEEHPPYDPRTQVNIETWKLKWGSTDDKKVYNRRLRRSVQASSEM
ncbi:MAG: hypothetical protein M1828_005600 [Chrysothrix sp. TS-e1954]|nr:MAG: hypothetical protein M1828_005600 [Chrysothrix sp. TS-e1954]